MDNVTEDNEKNFAICIMCEREVEFESTINLCEINNEEKCIYDINKSSHVWIIGHKPWFRCQQCGNLASEHVIKEDGKNICQRCDFNNTFEVNKSKEEWYGTI